MDFVITLLFFMLVLLFLSVLVGAVMFCIDIWKWSKRPEKYDSIENDLQSSEQNSDINEVKLGSKGSVWDE